MLTLYSNSAIILKKEQRNNRFTMRSRQQWAGTTGGGMLGQRLLIVLFKIINVKALYWVLWLVVPFYMLFRRESYNAIYDYFRHQWGEPPLKAFYKTYRNHIIFGQCMFDRFAVYAGQIDSFKLQFTDFQYFDRLQQEKSGFIVATAHIGNFEISGYLFGKMQKSMITMTFGGESKIVTTNREHQLNANDITALNNSADMAHIIALREALLSGQIAAIMCDRMFGSEKSVKCQFMNGYANFPQGAFALAINTNVPLLAIFSMKEGSTYHVHIISLEIDNMEKMNRQEKISAYAQKYAFALETVIRKYPLQWFNFYEFWNK
jgi:predicted LPLAT superfamily acyltransferase